ncbi:glycoside hydrolase family 76 protein [Daldinia caldariorum]|uniref:glycoside hydrolase family 76 protein n=1 Tax=Daldinia caldariorum TaxID=326644 RepID=UPI002008CF47|nr:glycoside hydrolase family 76 protein [Daldinia caldariorum]KAI1468153.1 glycoside hydrolase family 76 protein [Daldinia caldariorum]
MLSSPPFVVCGLLYIALASGVAIRKDVVPSDATKAAVDAMMALYDEKTGLWDPNSTASSWWQSGVALWALTEYMVKSGSHEYLPQALNTVKIQREPLAWWPGGDGEFRADSTDDTGWWALAMTSLYDLTDDEEYLLIAEEDEAYMYEYWNTTTCSGGLIWNIPSRTYHNAISNEIYLQLTAKLHNLIPGDTTYLNHSLREWEWFKNSGMINSDNLINDGLTDDASCVNNGMTTWTYNQGVILGGLVELYEATGDISYLDEAQQIADAVVNSATLVKDGTLTEPCSNEEVCEPNGTAFKGIFIQELAKLNAALDDHPYRSFISQNAVTAYENARNGSNFYGFQWQGPYDSVTVGTQEAAVQLLIAAYL